MSQRQTPQDFWRAKMQTQVSAPIDRPLPVTSDFAFPDFGNFGNNNGIIILGLVAVVGLLGLFALLGTTGKCKP